MGMALGLVGFALIIASLVIVTLTREERVSDRLNAPVVYMFWAGVALMIVAPIATSMSQAPA